MAVVENQNQPAVFYKRTLEITWLAIIFLIPLFFNNLGHQAFYLYKALLLQFLVMAMLGFWTAGWLLGQGSHNRPKWRDVLRSPLQLSVLVFGLLAILATAISITPAISFWGSYFIKAGLLTLVCWILFFLIVAQQLRHRAQIFRAIYTLLISSGIVSLVGILQRFFPGILPNLASTARVLSTTGNALSLSGFLAMVIPFNLFLIVYLWSKRKEGNNIKILIGLAVLLALQFWCLWLAQYSITILLYVIALVIFITLLGIFKRNRLLLSVGAVLIIILAVVAASLLSPMLVPGIGIKTPQSSSSDLYLDAENIGLNTLAGRVLYWRSAVDIVTESPEVPFSNDKLHGLRRLIGYGPETFIVTFQLFLPQKIGGHHTILSTPIISPHNHYLYLATTVGLLGLMSFLSILAVFFYLCYRYLRRPAADIYKLLLIAMTASIVQYMADMVFNPSTISTELIFWLTMSFIPVLGRLTTNDEPEQAKATNLTKFGSGQRRYVNKTRRYIALGSAVLFIFIGFGITVRPFLADMYLQKGLNFQAGRSDQAILAFDKAVKLSPGEAAYWNYLGLYSYSVARTLEEGELKTEILALTTNVLEKARELEPCIAYRYYMLADVYVYSAKAGDSDKWQTAFSLYDKASQLIPNNAIIISEWALALFIKGDFDEAQTKLNYAESIDPDWAGTSFVSGLLLAKDGENIEAALKITAPIQDDPINLNYFIDLCRTLIVYDMLSLVEDTLEARVVEAPNDWSAHAMLGITSLFNNDLDMSLDEFNTAMLLAPKEASGGIFRAILRLSSISPKFKASLPCVAAEWRDKLGQSPGNDTLLPALDQLVGTPK